MSINNYLVPNNMITYSNSSILSDSGKCFRTNETIFTIGEQYLLEIGSQNEPMHALYVS
jgi:hypothetical protein